MGKINAFCFWRDKICSIKYKRRQVRIFETGQHATVRGTRLCFPLFSFTSAELRIRTVNKLCQLSQLLKRPFNDIGTQKTLS